MIGVVLAGGPGERLMPLTKEKPKAFLKLAGKMLFEYSIEELQRAGIDDIIVVVPPNWNRGIPEVIEGVEVVNQEKEGSLESAFDVAFKKIEKSRRYREAVFSFVGFISAPQGMVKSTLEFYSTSGFPAVISSVPVLSGLETYGFVKLRGERVESFTAPFVGARREGGYVFGGVLVGNIDILRSLSNENYYKVLDSIAKKGLLGSIIWHGEWIEIGYPWDLLEVFNVLKKLLSPRIDYGALISRDATIEGEVIIEKGARILSGAVVEGPAYIGSGAYIGRNAIVVNSIVESDVIIKDRAKVERSVLLDGAVIGECSLVSHSIVGEKAVIGNYSFTEVGEPEKVPERFKPSIMFTRRPPNLGAVIGPESVIKPFTSTKPGEVVSS